MRIHVEDQPAAVLLAIIPARPLARYFDAVEHPPAEIDAEADDAAEEIRRRETRKLLQARQIKLVLDRPVLEAARLRDAQDRKPVRHRGRHRLFRVDVLAGGNRLHQRGVTLVRGGGVEEDRKGRIGQRCFEVNGPFGAVALGNGGEALGVAPDQQKARHDAAVFDRQATLVADRRQRVGQMLRRADAAGGAVEDDADRLGRHVLPATSWPGLSRPSTSLLPANNKK